MSRAGPALRRVIQSKPGLDIGVAHGPGASEKLARTKKATTAARARPTFPGTMEPYASHLLDRAVRPLVLVEYKDRDPNST